MISLKIEEPKKQSATQQLNDVPEAVRDMAMQEQHAKRDQIAADKLGVSVEKMQHMKRYAIAYRRNNPKVTEKQLKKKVAQYFNIKLTS